MKKIEFLAASLPYGQKYYHFDGNRETEHICLLTEYRHDEFTIADNEQEYYLELKNMIPIIRPLESLTKECVQADYNEGKPFIPAIELVKLEEKYSKWVDIAPSMPYNVKIIQKPFGKVLKVTKAEQWVVYLSLTEMERARYYIILQLIKWHFWPNMPEGEEVVYVTNEFNPYK